MQATFNQEKGSKQPPGNGKVPFTFQAPGIFPTGFYLTQFFNERCKDPRRDQKSWELKKKMLGKRYFSDKIAGTKKYQLLGIGSLEIALY